ncbi:MAG: purine-binding chemotaxis protein CheW [Solirubrobacteraceae bacterium]|jgi:purine-binding chemotaxis protein CheW|nr:purine-binding chemotaxis protein CheW [Solirubrobacteraceae bacterium]
MPGTYVRVGVGGEHYAVPVEHVLEVGAIGRITPVPGAERPLLGARNLRGEVLPIIDFGALIGVASEGPGQMVVAHADGLRAGLAVEQVVGVGELPDADLPADSAQLAGAVLVDGELIGVVDVAAALAGLVT